MGNANRNITPIPVRLRGSQINWNQVFYFSEIAAAGFQQVSQSFINFYISPQWSTTPFRDLLQKLPLLICNAEPMYRMEILGLTTLRVPPDAPKLRDNLFTLWAVEGENTAAVRQLKELLKEEGIGLR